MSSKFLKIVASVFLLVLGGFGLWSLPVFGQRVSESRKVTTIREPADVERLLTQLETKGESEPAVTPNIGCVDGLCIQLVHTLDDYMSALPSGGFVKFSVDIVTRDKIDPEKPILYAVTTGGRIGFQPLQKEGGSILTSGFGADFDQFLGDDKEQEQVASNHLCAAIAFLGRCCLSSAPDVYMCICCDTSSSPTMHCSCLAV